jgi:hypothetical protein
VVWGTRREAWRHERALAEPEEEEATAIDDLQLLSLSCLSVSLSSSSSSSTVCDGLEGFSMEAHAARERAVLLGQRPM